jgi:ornithine carbamoyltransferase
MNPFYGKSLLSLKDYSSEEIRLLLDLSKKVKAQRRAGEVHQRLVGKTIALIFEKTSTRTRCSFETAIGEEGGHGVFLNINDLQLGKKETVEDTARVLGRMFDGIGFRGFEQKTVQDLADYSGVPVYNGLTDLFHPTQILADLMTLEEEWGSLEGNGPLVYLGDGRNNMGNSLMIGCAIMNLPFTLSSPKALQPEDQLIQLARELGGPTWDFRIDPDPKSAVIGAGALYTDVWASMGEEDLLEERKAILGDYQVNQDLMDLTGNSKNPLPPLPTGRTGERGERRSHGRASKSGLGRSRKPQAHN